MAFTYAGLMGSRVFSDISVFGYLFVVFHPKQKKQLHKKREKTTWSTDTAVTNEQSWETTEDLLLLKSHMSASPPTFHPSSGLALGFHKFP